MNTIKTRFVEIVSYFFILLFCYASISKIMDFENFQIQIAQSPLLSSFSGIISYAILAAELAVCILLVFYKTRLTGLYSSFFLMVTFSIYIYMILNYGEYIPCSCGGILEKMDWETHLVFNMGTVILSAVAIIFKQRFSRQYRFSAGILTALSITSMLSLVILYQKSEYMIKKENNFVRRFLPHPLTEEKRFDLKLNSYYFAGSTSDSIYLGNYTSAFSLNSIGNNLTGINELNIVPDQYDLDFKRVQISVQNNNYYVSDGTVPIIYAGKLGKRNVKTISLGAAYFNQLKIINHDAFAISTFLQNDDTPILGMIYTSHSKQLELKEEIIPKTDNGVFFSDGQLHYDPVSRTSVYVHYYKNDLIIMDENLNLKSHYKTIDTISKPQISVQRLKEGKTKMSKPPQKVNRKALAYGGLLFVESDLIGKFENQDQWKKNFILDIYSLIKRQYVGSIYLPNPEKDKKMQFHISGNYLYVLKGNEIIKYRFAQNIVKHFITGEAENLNQE